MEPTWKWGGSRWLGWNWGGRYDQTMTLPLVAANNLPPYHVFSYLRSWLADLWQCCGLPATKSVPDIFTPNNRKTFVFYTFSRHFHGDRSDRTRCFQNHYLLYNTRSSTKVAMNQHSLKFFVSGSLQEIFFGHIQ